MTRVLVPVRILEGVSPPPGLIDLLGTVDVTVMGYHVLPEQTGPDQASDQYEERANDALDDIVAEFEAAGGSADKRLVFTHERGATIKRVAADTESDAFAILGATGPVDKLIVPLSGDVAVEAITSFVATLVGDRDIAVTLFLASADAAGSDEASLDDAAATLRGAGIEVTTKTAEGRPFDALVEAAAGHDAVVMGERAPSFRSLLFGEETDRVAAETVGPVLVVRNPETEPADDP